MAAQDGYKSGLRERETRQAHLDTIVRAAADSVALSVAETPPPLHSHFFYGASAIHPRHLVVWYLFRTDAEYLQARATGLTTRIESRTRQKLHEGGYPAEWIAVVTVSFTTDEDIRRSTGGNYFHYFK